MSARPATPHTPQAPATNVAYSYLRLSSDRQRKGDGERRQMELTENYCAEKGLRLDRSIRDIGVSGFSGANRERGALKQFLEIVRSGRVARGSHLVVESLDRLSRDLVMRAFAVFTELLEAGIVIHTIADRKVYSWDTVNGNTADLIISITIMIRANEESAMKAHRQRSTWENKRLNAGALKLTAKCPTWLELTPDRKSFAVVQARALVLQRIFQETADGIGCDKIARRLNAEGVEPFSHGRSWYGGTVRAYLENRAVVGEYHPHRMEVSEENGVRITRRGPAGDPIPDYYPRVISDELWHRAWASVATRRQAGAGNAGGRKGTKLANLFSGLARCCRCDSVMNVRDRGARRRSPAFLQCASFRNGTGCPNNKQFPLEALEEGVLTFLQELDLRDAAPVEVRVLETSLAGLCERAEKARDRIDVLLELAAEGSKQARAKVPIEEEALAALEAEITQGEERLKTLRGAVPITERQAALSDLRERLDEPRADIYLIRSKLRQSLREVVDFMVFGPDGGVTIGVESLAAAYRFENGRKVRREEWPLGQPSGGECL